ncbi:MAG: rRNA maturation RNase YbeY [Myxococcota bacterium]
MALSVLGFPEAELSVTLADDAQIAELAGRYGRPRRATDVLAFPLHEGVGGWLEHPCLGDLVLSIERAEAQARERGVSLQQELQALLIHGLLHLLGMDHHRPAHARAMRELEKRLYWELAQAL